MLETSKVVPVLKPLQLIQNATTHLVFNQPTFSRLSPSPLHLWQTWALYSPRAKYAPRADSDQPVKDCKSHEYGMLQKFRTLGRCVVSLLWIVCFLHRTLLYLHRVNLAKRAHIHMHCQPGYHVSTIPSLVGILLCFQNVVVG